jgi:hypothetical protein
MFTFSIFGRKNNANAARSPRGCRRSPLVEALEGRQLLSTLGGGGVGRHIGISADAIQGNHIGVSAAIQGNHIG